MNKKEAEEILENERKKFKTIEDLKMYMHDEEEAHNRKMELLKWVLYELERMYVYDV